MRHRAAWLLCAWVLWEEVEYFEKAGRKIVWRPSEGYEQKAECDRGMRAEFIDAARRYNSNTFKSTFNVKNSYAVYFTKPEAKDELVWIVKLWCFPAGTNPVQPEKVR